MAYAGRRPGRAACALYTVRPGSGKCHFLRKACDFGPHSSAGSANSARSRALLVRMAGFAALEAGQQRRPRQRHVADGVQDLVAHEFVGKALAVAG